MKNILIVDDSALMRRLISDIIKSDDRFTVKDFAMNGLEALDLIVKNYRAYDAVILDAKDEWSGTSGTASEKQNSNEDYYGKYTDERRCTGNHNRIGARCF